MSLSIRFTGVAATVAIALGGGFAVSAASADDAPTTEPCAREQVKVDKAEAALERVTAVFARQEARVAEATAVVEQARAGRERAEARHALAAARHDRDETKVIKRAQQQRVAKAQERLTECEAAGAPAAG